MRVDRPLLGAVISLGWGIGLIVGYCKGTTGFNAAYPFAGSVLHLDLTTVGPAAIGGLALIALGILLLAWAVLAALTTAFTSRVGIADEDEEEEEEVERQQRFSVVPKNTYSVTPQPRWASEPEARHQEHVVPPSRWAAAPEPRREHNPVMQRPRWSSVPEPVEIVEHEAAERVVPAPVAPPEVAQPPVVPQAEAPQPRWSSVPEPVLQEHVAPPVQPSAEKPHPEIIAPERTKAKKPAPRPAPSHDAVWWTGEEDEAELEPEERERELWSRSRSRRVI